MPRAPILVTPNDHPDWVTVTETDNFEDYFRRADELYQQGDLRIHIWQKVSHSALSGIPTNSQLFQTVREPRDRSSLLGDDLIHIDASDANPEDKDRPFDGQIVRVSEEFNGLGTGFFSIAAEHIARKPVYERLLARVKAIKLDDYNPYHAAFRGPVRLQAGQGAMIYKRSAGELATLHSVATRSSLIGERKTVLTDIKPRLRVNTPSSGTVCNLESL